MQGSELLCGPCKPLSTRPASNTFDSYCTSKTFGRHGTVLVTMYRLPRPCRFLNILKYLCLESRFSSLYHLSANSNIWKHCPIYRIGSAKIKEATWKIKDSIESTSKRCFYSSKRRESEHLKRLKNAKTWRNETESCFASLSNFTWALLHARGC